MSKYADIEQIKKTIREEWVKYIPMDLDMHISFVLGKISEVPTIEISDDCIDRKALLEQIYAESEGRTGYGDEWEFIDTINNAPSVVPSRATGDWIFTDQDEPCWFRCSECGRYYDLDENYCPNCGAYMRGDTE